MNVVSARGASWLIFAAAACGTSGEGTSSVAPAPNEARAPAAAPSAAASAPSATPSSPPTSPPPPSCPAAEGKLVVYAIPPSTSLDWSSPNRLLASVAESSVTERVLVTGGKAKLAHPIGHAHLELECGDLSIPLTGQTGGGSEWKSGGDGFGVVFRDLDGTMNEFPGPEHDDMVADVKARHASGSISRIAFSISRATCARIKTFHDEYNKRASYKRYSGVARARRFEGAGCAIYGAGVIDVAGLLRRSLFTPVWARSVLVGSARFADVLGKGHYRFGSNLVAPGAQGTSLVWPKGVDIPASTVPIFPGTTRLDTWNGPEDAPFAVPALTSEMSTKVPFSIYDPQLMSEWAEAVWTQATSAPGGTASALGVTWTAATVDHAHEVVTDAHCTPPQTIAFDADNDDLFKDSDAP